MNKSITVIGGANVDIGGRPAAALALYDSSPGQIHLSYGGVGRNVAHDLCLLGRQVSLLTAFGGDAWGEGLRAHCLALGMDLSLSLVLPDRRSSVYLAVSDGSGDLLAGIADMGITACILPEDLERRLERINASGAVVVDANLEPGTLRWIGERVRPVLYADPVSVAKAQRLLPLLPRLRAVKANAAEAERLTGCSDPSAALDALLEAGVQRAFISLGAAGMLAGEGRERLSLPCEKRPVVNSSGAGDAALAALVDCDLSGGSLADCVKHALRAAAITCGCEESNHPDLGRLMRSDP